MTSITRFAILLFITCLNLPSAWGAGKSSLLKVGDKPLYFQFQQAFSSETDFHHAVAFFDYERSQEGSFVTALSVGRKVSDYVLVWPFSVVAYASVQKLDERGYQTDAWGVSIYAKAYHTFNFAYTDLPIRLGFGQGLSYVSRIPVSESRDFDPHPSEKLLYYLDYSLQVSLRRLTNYRLVPQSMEEVYVGYTVWHRSTLFGLLGESTAGINYLGLSIETVFK